MYFKKTTSALLPDSEFANCLEPYRVFVCRIMWNQCFFVSVLNLLIHPCHQCFKMQVPNYEDYPKSNLSKIPKVTKSRPIAWKSYSKRPEVHNEDIVCLSAWQCWVTYNAPNQGPSSAFWLKIFGDITYSPDLALSNFFLFSQLKEITRWIPVQYWSAGQEYCWFVLPSTTTWVLWNGYAQSFQKLF